MTASKTAFSEPSDVTATAGEVHVDGPDGVAFAMTPGAAEETGRRMIRASDEARRQDAAPPQS